MSAHVADVDGETCRTLRAVSCGEDVLYEKARALFKAQWFRSHSLIKDAHAKRNINSAWLRVIKKGEDEGIPALFFDNFLEAMTPAARPPAARTPPPLRVGAPGELVMPAMMPNVKFKLPKQKLDAPFYNSEKLLKDKSGQKRYYNTEHARVYEFHYGVSKSGRMGIVDKRYSLHKTAAELEHQLTKRGGISRTMEKLSMAIASNAVNGGGDDGIPDKTLTIMRGTFNLIESFEITVKQKLEVIREEQHANARTWSKKQVDYFIVDKSRSTEGITHVATFLVLAALAQ